ncbi:hypothetical protein ACQQ2N_12245 [Dokdonella sp. MW10]|uniref:hypothetical protein n=1 Tax=Dokdonella sp. MW10 TaxID=2992926 RepID=UPI003F8127E6
MSAPQYLVILGMLVNVSFALAAHGTARTGRNNARDNLVAVAALAACLWWGGFFG